MSEFGPLETVSDYISDTRTLLLDTVSPYRYDDMSLLLAFNLALREGRRLRPDLFVFRHHDKVPYFPAVNSDEVEMEDQFRMAFVYGTASHAMARDQEDVQDQRANSFMAVFRSILTGINPPVISGGQPEQGS